MTQQIHADMVESKPDGFELLGSSELTPVQGLAKLYPEDDIPAFAHSECCCGTLCSLLADSRLMIGQG